jgi:hypothetical protein
VAMDPYDARAWAQVEHWRDHKLTAQARKLVPDAVRTPVRALAERGRDAAMHIPGASMVETALERSLLGLTELTATAGAASLRRSAVVRAFQKAGHDVNELEDVRQLPLKAIDKVKPRLGLYYSAASAAQGGVAGLAVSGGEIVGATTAGAAAAPSAAVVAGAMAADAAALLASSHRSVAHIAAYYGYDVELEHERLYALGVLGVGTATGAAKVASYAELNKLVQALARRQAWQQLNQNSVTKVVQRVYPLLGQKLTKRKLAQAVPLAGILIGAGLNAAMLAEVVRDADHIYRERFLRDKYALDLVWSGGSAPAGHDVIALADIVDAELVEHTTAEQPPLGLGD